MANPLDVISENWKKSQLGNAVASIPADNRPASERIKDMIASNPNTPQFSPQESIPMQRPEPQGPAPASIEMQNAHAPVKNWNLPQNPAVQANPFQQASDLISRMPSQGMNTQIAAQKGIGDAQSQGFKEQEAAYGEQGQHLAESEKRLTDIQKERDDVRKKFDADYDAASADLKNTTIDNDRLWKNKTTASKIMTGIGLALSAFGGPEAVARTNQIIQGAIDRDIEEQKANYGIKKEGVQNMQNVYSLMMDKFGDKEKAELATRAFYNDQLQNKIQQIASRTNSTAAKENAKLQIGQLQSQKDGIVSQLGLTMAQTAANKGPEYDQVISDKYNPRNEDERKRYIPGVGLATDSESAKKVKENVETFGKFNNSLGRMIELRKKYGSETLPSDAKGEMMQIHAKLKLAMKDMAKLGVMSDTDSQLLDNIIANPTSFNPNTLSRLESLKTSSLGEFSQSLKPHLMNPTQSLAAKLKTGQF
jgi:hypothetical protein